MEDSSQGEVITRLELANDNLRRLLAEERGKHNVTESIYSGSVVVPLADVQHIEPWPKNVVPGVFIITKHTRWDWERDGWANAIWISDPEAIEFKLAWCRYRSELEADTLANLEPAPAQTEEWLSMPTKGICSVSKQKQRPGEPEIWVAVHEPVKAGGMSIAARGASELEARQNAIKQAAPAPSPPHAAEKG